MHKIPQPQQHHSQLVQNNVLHTFCRHLLLREWSPFFWHLIRVMGLQKKFNVVSTAADPGGKLRK